MQTIRTALVFLTFATATAFAPPALASRHPTSPVTAFCGDRYCPTGIASPQIRMKKVTRARRPASEGVRVARTPEKQVEKQEKIAESGLIRSKKTGETAHVGARWAPMFQAYVDDLENHGASIYYMGGIRPGRCSEGSQHPCGKALDVCQDARGRVSGEKDCHLPPPAEMAAIARLHGLYEGSRWCHSDYGHAQVTPSGGDCTPTGYARGVRFVGYLATMTGKVVAEASAKARRTRHVRHHVHRVRYARG